jgi:NADP-dependent 3-hydroxy acid dehydrogenase YdfG
VITTQLMAGQVAVETSASRGIGKQLALTLAHHRAAVTAGARGTDTLTGYPGEITDAGGTAWTVWLDNATSSHFLPERLAIQATLPRTPAGRIRKYGFRAATGQ